MKAIQLVGHGKPGNFELRDVPDPVPAPDQVVVQVKACGLNHLDLWVEEGGLPVPVHLPRTPGGEVAGQVVALGADVDEWRIGERVAIQSNLFCGDCEYCERGDESLCLNGRLLGVDCDGGFAEKALVPSRVLVRLPSNVSYEASAALTLAGSTAMHMLTHRTQVWSGQWVLVIAGASGVGSAAIQIAKQFGARVISTGSTEAKRRLASQLGAEFVVDSSSPDWASQVRGITQKRGVELIVEHVGGETLVQALTCLARGGVIVTCGATAGREVGINLWPFFVKEQQLIGSYGRNLADIVETLRWASEGRLEPVIEKTVTLSETPTAIQALRARSVLGKRVVAV